MCFCIWVSLLAVVPQLVVLFSSFHYLHLFLEAGCPLLALDWHLFLEEMGSVNVLLHSYETKYVGQYNVAMHSHGILV